MQLSLIKQRISDEMKRRGFNATSLATAAGLGNTAVRDLLGNTEQDPRIGTLQRICTALELPLSALFSDGKVFSDDSVIVPELNVRASAGGGANNSHEEVETNWVLPRGYLETLDIKSMESLRIIRVHGDSMTPEYRPNDRILVNTDDRVPSDGDYVLVDGFGNLLVKKLKVIPGTVPPRIKVISSNKLYDTYDLDANEIHVNGKVIGKWDWR